MELKKAKSLVNDILDICSHFDDETLTEACSGIYNDVHAAKNVENVISSLRELMVFISESYDFCSDGIEDFKEEIDTIFYQILEESEEF